MEQPTEKPRAYLVPKEFKYMVIHIDREDVYRSAIVTDPMDGEIIVEDTAEEAVEILKVITKMTGGNINDFLVLQIEV